VQLTFVNDVLARLCNQHEVLAAWAGDDVAAVEQLLNELDCADTLGRVEEFPHVTLVRAAKGRVGANGADEARVLLQPEMAKSKTFRDAEAAVVIAVAAGEEHFNPEGAAWPQAFAMSRTTR
jgi:hypothetical protein